MHKIADDLYTEDGWNLIKTKYLESQAITDGTTFLLGNGYLGYRGTFCEDKKSAYVGCIVTDTWDKTDEKWEELCNVPNGLFAELSFQGKPINLNHESDFKRIFNIKNGLFERSIKKQLSNGTTLKFKEKKFVSYSEKSVLGLRLEFNVDNPTEITIKSGIDYDQWNINGDHLKNHTSFINQESQGIIAKTQEKETTIVVLEKTLAKSPYEVIDDDYFYGKSYTLKLNANQTYAFEKFMIVQTSNDIADPQNHVIKIAKKLKSFQESLIQSSFAWEYLWKFHDIVIKGDLNDQVSLRYNLYQAIIATPTHKPLPIGARGLSCQAYQGAAFWDQEIYNLPMYLYSRPEVAKNILVYRYNTLDGARKKAKINGYNGAFYAWISGKTGEELCPDFFFKDVLSNRPIRNHFNLWQIHISFDIAYSIHRYYIATEDFDFMVKYGLEMLVEIARFAASRVVYLPVLKQYEIRQVQGPDEYHENVDNNAFTNYMAHFALEYTLHYLTIIDDDVLKTLRNRLKITHNEILLWRDIYEKLYLPTPNNKGILEQFDGYLKLESIVPASKVTERLIDSEEYYGWPNGITVFTQCLKQADVIQLISIHPNLFPKNIVNKNYNFYEPRTLHFSSLSPSTYAIVAARLGKTGDAYLNFKRSLMIDLLNTNESVSGGTFIGGTHTAANGASWQVVVFGFLGMNFDDERIVFNPQLPEHWEEVNTQIAYKNHLIHVCATKENINLSITKSDSSSINILINDHTYKLNSNLNILYKK